MNKFIVAFGFIVATAGMAQAAEVTSAMYSPKCTAEQLQGIPGVVKVEKGAFEGGFNVTIDDTKTDSMKLTVAMQEKGCM